MSQKIYCEVLERFERGPLRVDLWYAATKPVWWVEVYFTQQRILQSEGYAQQQLGEEAYEKTLERLPLILRRFLERNGPAPIG